MNKVRISNNLKRENLIVANDAVLADVIEQAGMPTEGIVWQMNGVPVNNLNQTFADLGVEDDTNVWLARVVKADCAC